MDAFFTNLAGTEVSLCIGHAGELVPLRRILKDLSIIMRKFSIFFHFTLQ